MQPTRYLFFAILTVFPALDAAENAAENNQGIPQRRRADGTSLTLGLLLPVTGSWRGGRTIAGAAALAVQRINADSSLLGGMRVEYAWADAGCGVKSGVDAQAMLLGSNRLDAVIGPGAHASASLLASVGM